jgi:GMP synthase (glutamine-hydrolysing)
MSVKGILVLKAGEALAPVKHAFGDFEKWIARGLGCEVEALQVAELYRGDPLPRASEHAGVVVTGSPAMVSDRADWSEAAARWLGEAVRADATPILGICYGHQLLAHGLGGEVRANARGREMGSFEIRFDAGLAPLFEAGTFPVQMSHVESVVKKPPGARVLARTDLDPCSVLAFGPRQWGVQFHPEFDRPIMQAYLEARREVLIEEAFEPDAMIGAVVDTPASAGVLARFADLVGA